MLLEVSSSLQGHLPFYHLYYPLPETGQPQARPTFPALQAEYSSSVNFLEVYCTGSEPTRAHYATPFLVDWEFKPSAIHFSLDLDTRATRVDVIQFSLDFDSRNANPHPDSQVGPLDYSPFQHSKRIFKCDR